MTPAGRKPGARPLLLPFFVRRRLLERYDAIAGRRGQTRTTMLLRFIERALRGEVRPLAEDSLAAPPAVGSACFRHSNIRVSASMRQGVDDLAESLGYSRSRLMRGLMAAEVRADEAAGGAE